MPKGRADISNFAIRVFLQEIGQEYDRSRSLEVFDGRKHFEEVRRFFDDRCCYCGVAFGAHRAVQDHLVPLNKDAVGLHAWGNVVPACAECNAKKQGRDWQEFLIDSVQSAADMKARKARIEAFRRKYRYAPDLNLRAMANELYADVGAVTIALIDTRLDRAKEKMARGD